MSQRMNIPAQTVIQKMESEILDFEMSTDKNMNRYS